MRKKWEDVFATVIILISLSILGHILWEKFYYKELFADEIMKIPGVIGSAPLYPDDNYNAYTNRYEIHLAESCPDHERLEEKVKDIAGKYGVNVVQFDYRKNYGCDAISDHLH